MARPLVIGVGMPMAGDDAAGRLVAQRLAGNDRGFDIAECQGMAADLVLLFEGRARVLVVDACRSGAAPGTLLRFDAITGTLPASPRAVSSHGSGVEEAIRLGRALGVLPERCDLWAIEGADFSLGAAMTPAVSAAVERCVAEIPACLAAAERAIPRP
ncbi:hydrogenase maturation protease [Tropicimonas sp. IMCC6043]|uniref:hydrogenase maturation protease n=1 Tax=Tropicimonas sp. IMCC6043 TaxID=2510645 RepID=UPI00101BAE52|nr:hydrogenase maturation protease [Tropicimonas sp. IMCC6043]RYH10805.1 hydrogenase maturation protease [Tropicimonas sp. IMCC6043]